jgi:hypothetical protein
VLSMMFSGAETDVVSVAHAAPPWRAPQGKGAVGATRAWPPGITKRRALVLATERSGAARLPFHYGALARRGPAWQRGGECDGGRVGHGGRVCWAAVLTWLGRRVRET